MCADKYGIAVFFFSFNSHFGGPAIDTCVIDIDIYTLTHRARTRAQKTKSVGVEVRNRLVIKYSNNRLIESSILLFRVETFFKCGSV